MRRLVLSGFSLGLVCFLSWAPAGGVGAWDGIGHLLVDQVALERLKPGVKEKLEAFAGQLVFPGVAYDALTMGCWMDDLRTSDPEVPFHGQFKSWHYIDIGLSPGDPMPAFTVTDPGDEQAGNVVQALQRAVAVMKGGTDPLITSRAMAAAMIMHLVGDIHQPLHCSTYYYPGASSFGRYDNDRGGNRVTITDSDEEPDRMGPRKLNLHAFWDGAYRAGFEEGKVALAPVHHGWGHRDSDVDPYLFDFGADAPDAGVSLQADFKAWAFESNQLAKDYIYGALTFDPAHRRTYLSGEQVKSANELARRRLVLAGYRLAQLLNELLAPVPAGG